MAKRKKITAKDVRKSILSKTVRSSIPKEDRLSTGSVALNLYCSGRTDYGFSKGLYIYLVGDTQSYKTWFVFTWFAEAAKNPNFEDYTFYFDNVENGMLANVQRYFGKKVAERLKDPPNGTSVTVEDMYRNVRDAVDEGPCIYVVDSENALTTKTEVEEVEKEKATMGMDKAKQHSRRIRVLANRLKKTGSILIVIGQTRQRVGYGAQYDPKTRSGGLALAFFAHLELWTSVKMPLKRKVKGQKLQIGALIKVKVKKNRVSSRKWAMEVPFYDEFGLDDTGSMVHFLVSNGHWKRKGAKEDSQIVASDFGITGDLDKVAKWIEANDKERQLRKLVRKVWKEIEEECKIERKKRYE